MLSLLLTLAPLASGFLGTPVPVQSGSYAIQARVLYLGDGRTLERGILIVDEGKISSVSAGTNLPNGMRLVQHDGAISPGLISAREESNLGAEAQDGTRAMLPLAQVVDAFDPTSKELRAAARAGVTTVLLAPSASSLVGGQTAAVKSAGGRILKRSSHLAIALSSASLRMDTPPTSPMGAIAVLEAQLSANGPVFADVKSGRLPLLIHAVQPHEILRSIEFATRNKLKGSLWAAPLAGELAESIRTAGLSVVLQAFSGGENLREIRSVAALAKAGVPFAFGIDVANGGPDALRLGAAMCLRENVDRKALDKALFSNAATICGVGEHVGLLERGYDADFLLWSGDPLDLTSRLEAVYIDGVRVDTTKQ